MKNTLKAILAYCFYKVKFDSPKEAVDMKSLTKKMKWTFEMHPRKLNWILAVTVLLPILILIGGVMCIPQCYRDCFRVASFSSYEFLLEKDEKPKKFDAYKKI